MTLAKTKHLWRLLIPALVIVALAYYLLRGDTAVAKYVTAPVTRGPIVRQVVATGTVNPVTVVQVGTYVSGPITEIKVDFNSAVKAGQLMAKIDPRPFAAQVALSRAALANAEAQLRKDKANLAYQKITYQRDAELLKQAVVSQDTVDSQHSTYDQAVAQVGLDQAAIQQQQASLQAALLNLNYTNIVSPVDGTVVSRNVDVGQTVAASYQTPTLFLVARDLTKMQVDANVSESDVGSVQVGQAGDFTVDAYPARVFKGVVHQIRQAPITVQNVVTYDVVVAVSNPEILLLPGMTANLTITTDERDNVLRVPLRTLAFSPHRRPASVTPRDDAPGDHTAHVWVDDDGQLRRVAIVRGLDDGNDVEVVSGGLKVGDQVVVEQTRSDENASHHFGAGPHLHM